PERLAPRRRTALRGARSAEAQDADARRAPLRRRLRLACRRLAPAVAARLARPAAARAVGERSRLSRARRRARRRPRRAPRAAARPARPRAARGCASNGDGLALRLCAGGLLPLDARRLAAAEVRRRVAADEAHAAHGAVLRRRPRGRLRPRAARPRRLGIRTDRSASAVPRGPRLGPQRPL